MTSYLKEYYQAIEKGEFIVGNELKTELDSLIADLDNKEYRYDTRKAHLIIGFMENCIRLTKSPFYNCHYLFCKSII